MSHPTKPLPRGIEVLVKKASVDPAFKTLLLERRAEAAREIELQLNPAEAAMLGAIPRDQLERIIEQTEVPQESRRAFLGKTAAAMLAALGVGLWVTCGIPFYSSYGNRPDHFQRLRRFLIPKEPEPAPSSMHEPFSIPNNPRIADPKTTSTTSSGTLQGVMAQDAPSTSSTLKTGEGQ